LPKAAAIVASLPDLIEAQGITPPAISVPDGQAAGTLPGLHRDPSDRTLITRAMLNQPDPGVERAPVRRLWRASPRVVSARKRHAASAPSNISWSHCCCSSSSALEIVHLLTGSQGRDQFRHISKAEEIAATLRHRAATIVLSQSFQPNQCKARTCYSQYYLVERSQLFRSGDRIWSV
jgi:hypothetical protein